MPVGQRREETIRRFVILVLVLAVGACQRIQPIYSVQGHAVPTASAILAPDQVMQLIVSAAQSKGWTIDPINPTQVRATQKWRTHSATVIISTDGKTYSINFDGSTNLSQSGGIVHREYNERVRALENEIDRRLQQRS
jgi:hypothetical protein